MHLIKQLLKRVARSGILLSIFVIILLVVVNGAFMVSSVNKLAKNKEYSADVNTIKSDFDGMLNNIQMTDLALRGYYIVPEEQMLSPLGDAEKGHTQVFSSLEKMFEKYDLDAQKLADMKRKFADYMKLDTDLIANISNGNTDQVVQVVKTDPGYELWKEYRAFRDPIIEELDQNLAIATAEYDRTIKNTVIIQIVLFLICLPTLLLIIRKIRRNNKMRKAYFQSISENNKKYIYNNNEETKDSEEGIINELVSNLKEASNYINSITNGNYEVQWNGMTADLRQFNKKNLAGELIKMKHKMIEVKKEDEQRLWTTEGTAKFAEIVRSDFGSLAEMSDSIISNVVKYLNANQGGIFLVDEDENTKETFMELTGCYAYDRKRYIDKRILPGQGLIGQTYKEGTTLHLKEIPNNYVSITSGLGEATPDSLLIVPLVVNENIVGLMEIASFNEFAKHEIEFLEKVGEIIASSINSIKTNEKTKKILEISQEQAETMQSQEEEMRQNMEEMEATHEEMRRNEQRMEQLLKEAEYREKTFKDVEEKLNEEIIELKKKIKKSEKQADNQKIEFNQNNTDKEESEKNKAKK